MTMSLSEELEKNQTEWSDYYKTVEFCGKDSPQAISMLQVCIANGKRIEQENLINKGE